MSTIAASRRAFSSLTAEGRRLSGRELLDASMAYPRIAPPAWIEELVTRPRWPEPADSEAVDERAKRAAAAFLGIPAFPTERIALASAAGLALDRALAAVVSPGSLALITSPSIDIVPAMLAERGVNMHCVAAAPPEFAFDAGRIGAALRKQDADALVLGAPENPTGAYLGDAQLRDVVAAAASAGTAVVMDQCAATLHREDSPVPLLAALDPPEVEWIMLWDTGKSFGLGGEKLAFLFASRSLAARVRECVSLVEYEAPLRVRMLVAELLEDARSHAYVRDLVTLVERNRTRLGELCAAHNLTAVPTAASSLQLVRGERGSADRLWAGGVGIVPGDCFFHAGELYAGDRFRVALAREAAYFDAVLAASDAALAGS